MRRKRVLMLLVAMVLCFSMVVSAGEYQVSEDKVELSFHFHIWDRLVFEDDWPVFKKAEELTNIKLKGTASKSATDSEQVFNLMLASGEIADIVVLQESFEEKFVQYAQEGAFIPLNDLIDSHAPHIKEFLDSHPDIRKNVIAPDGNIYYIPYVPDGDVAMGWFIRKDWLDKLNLEIPETIEEYYQVLKAFKERDPNGNGKQDEIPYFRRNPYGIRDLLIFWNARPDFYIEDGKVHYGPYEDQFKVGVKNITKWYEEGLVDPEIFTRGWSARDELLGDNIGGSTHDWFGSTSSYNDKLKDKIDGFEFIPIAPPKCIDGIAREESKRSHIRSCGWGISYTNENPELTMKYFDFWWTEKGRRLTNFGVEGVTYDMVNGKPQFKDKILNSDTPVNRLLWDEYGAQLEMGVHQDFEYEKQWMNPIALKGVEMYMENDYPIDQFPKLSFTTEEKDILDNLKPDIETLAEEAFQEWVLGAESIEDNFRKYQEIMRDMGIEKVLDIYQTAYDRYMKQ